MAHASTGRFRFALRSIWSGSLIVAISLLAASTAHAFHGHRAVVRPPGVAYWGSAYATRGHAHYVYRPYVYRPAARYYSAYRPYAYAPRVYAPRVYRPYPYAYGYRTYYRPARYGVYSYDPFCSPYTTYRTYYSGWPIGGAVGIDPWLGVAPVGWFGAADAVLADPGIAAPVNVDLEDDNFVNNGVRPAGNVPVRAIAAARPLVQQLLGGRSEGTAGLVNQVMDRVVTNRSRVINTQAISQPASRSTASSSTEEGRRRAANYVQQGDDLFSRGRYLEAHSVYQRASSAATDIAEPWFRQGYAYLAAGRYERAVTAFRRGVELEPEYANSGFRWSRLYGGNRSMQDQHIEALAQAALDAPENADLMFLVGVALYGNGERERATPFFVKAAELSVPGAAHIAAFQAPGFDRSPLTDDMSPAQPAARTAVR